MWILDELKGMRESDRIAIIHRNKTITFKELWLLSEKTPVNFLAPLPLKWTASEKSSKVNSKYPFFNKLKEITNYCYQNDIKLVLIETPLPDATLSKENYQPYVDYMREYANKNGLQYLNFNL